MSEQNYIEYEAVVLRSMGNATFLVKLDDIEKEVICTISGKVRSNRIRIIEGDRVKVDVSVYDPDRGRITYRHKK